MARGDVVRVELPPVPDQVSGHEQAGTRPAVAVQADAPGTSTVMIVPFTSRLEALRFPYTFRVEPSPTNGLERPSVLLASQLRAIDRRRILGTLGRLELAYMTRLEQELQRLLSLGGPDNDPEANA